jgi:hypothetical protein
MTTTKSHIFNHNLHHEAHNSIPIPRSPHLPAVHLPPPPHLLRLFPPLSFLNATQTRDRSTHHSFWAAAFRARRQCPTRRCQSREAAKAGRVAEAWAGSEGRGGGIGRWDGEAEEVLEGCAR